jgi:hypothetical protein
MSYLLVDPSSVLSWSFDWADWLDYSSPVDTIASRQWTIEPLYAGSPTMPTLTNATQEIVVAQGFLAGNIYRLTEQITSAGGLVDQRTIVLRCENT